MKVICKKVRIKDLVLQEETNNIIFIKDDKIFKDALFFELDNQYEKIIKVYKEITFEGSEINVLKNVLDFYMKNAIKVYKDTLKTLQHWQFINGFTSIIINNNLYQYAILQKNILAYNGINILNYSKLTDEDDPYCVYSDSNNQGIAKLSVIKKINSVDDYNKLLSLKCNKKIYMDNKLINSNVCFDNWLNTSLENIKII